MKTKIEIKSIDGSILFELEKEENTVKETVIEAVKKDADLSDADLRCVNLRDADLRGAELRDADVNKIKIKKAAVFTGLYEYIVIPFISEDNVNWLKLGCYTRTLEEWNNDFWNNDKEFPNDNSEKSNLRLFAFETAKKWFELQDKL